MCDSVTTERTTALNPAKFSEKPFFSSTTWKMPMGHPLSTPKNRGTLRFGRSTKVGHFVLNVVSFLAKNFFLPSASASLHTGIAVHLP